MCWSSTFCEYYMHLILFGAFYGGKSNNNNAVHCLFSIFLDDCVLELTEKYLDDIKPYTG